MRYIKIKSIIDITVLDIKENKTYQYSPEHKISVLGMKFVLHKECVKIDVLLGSPDRIPIKEFLSDYPILTLINGKIYYKPQVIITFSQGNRRSIKVYDTLTEAQEEADRIKKFIETTTDKLIEI
jgi:hypothetical protein